MKKQPHRSPDREVRLGAWKVLILHQAASKPVWGSQLFRLLIDRGFHLAQSAFHDALNVMVRNGWLHRTMGRYRTAQLTITPKGREHLI